VWSHDGKRVVVHLLQPSGSYAPCDHSAAFPQLELAELVSFLERVGSESETRIVRAFRSRVGQRFGAR
jgi:hypothetical protein